MLPRIITSYLSFTEKRASFEYNPRQFLLLQILSFMRKRFSHCLSSKSCLLTTQTTLASSIHEHRLLGLSLFKLLKHYLHIMHILF